MSTITDKGRQGMRFPETPTFAGFNAPGRVEADIYELEADGHIPLDLCGRFYQTRPEPQFPPLGGDDIIINGDGMLTMFRFADGHVDFKSRYIKTAKYQIERAARRSLFGRYRNPFTDDPSVRGISKGTANTNIIWHGGRLLALKEDALPVQLDPDTLETIGEWTWNGQIKSRTLTAHPKFNPLTGEMYTFGYAAKGETTRDIAFYVVDAGGRITMEQWLEAPFSSMIHDFAVTEDHVIIACMPTTGDLDRLKGGGPAWLWDPTRPTMVGIFPLHADGAKEIRWFEGPSRCIYHYYNAFRRGSKIIVDGVPSDTNTFPFMYPDTTGGAFDPSHAVPQTRRWIFDLNGPSGRFEEETLWTEYAEFPRIDERFALREHRYGFAIAHDPGRSFDGGGLFGPAFNTIARYDFKTGERRCYALEGNSTAQEAVFVPRHDQAAEGDGYLISLVNRYDTMLNDLLVLDAMRLEDGPIASIKLPLRLRNAIHGNWVAEHLLGWRAQA
jgi:carotenoid cleavage dioxygenase